MIRKQLLVKLQNFPSPTPISWGMSSFLCANLDPNLIHTVSVLCGNSHIKNQLDPFRHCDTPTSHTRIVTSCLYVCLRSSLTYLLIYTRTDIDASTTSGARKERKEKEEYLYSAFYVL